VATRNTEAPAVLIEGGPGVSEAVIDALAEAAGTYTSLAVQTSLNPFNSDHVPFIDAGVPAVLTIEGADRANQNVHTRDDTLDHIDFDLFLQILTMNVAFLAGALGESGGP
ncbi:MAG: M28 family peptidase, partial [Thermoanaerobaculia bacterium]